MDFDLGQFLNSAVCLVTKNVDLGNYQHVLAIIVGLILVTLALKIVKGIVNMLLSVIIVAGLTYCVLTYCLG